MKMSEIVDEVSFMLGSPLNHFTEDIQLEQAVRIAFRELKSSMRMSTEKTVPFSTRLNLKKLGIETRKVLNVMPSKPRIGLTLNSIDSGNVFQVAAAVNSYSGIGQISSLNIDPIVTEMAMAQVRNTLSTDFQWKYDIHNQVVYCTHRDPRPATVTVRYVPDYQDVSEIENYTWVNYLIRLSHAYAKLALGRARSKYTIEGSNVSLDGEALLAEANAELEQIRSELDEKGKKFVIVN